MQIPDTVVVVSGSGPGTSPLMTVLIAVAAAVVAALASYLTQERKFKADLRQQETRIKADLEQQEMRIKADLELQQQAMRTEYMAEQAIRRLLEHEKYRMREFSIIKRRIAGFEDDQLRRLLVRAGAVRFKGDGDEEYWGLISKNDLR